MRSPVLQHGHAGRRKAQVAAAAGLGSCLVAARDGQALTRKIEVLPAQPEQLALAQAGVQGQVDARRQQAVAPGARGQLGGAAQDAGRFLLAEEISARRGWRPLDSAHRVVRHKLQPLRPREHRAQVGQRRAHAGRRAAAPELIARALDIGRLERIGPLAAQSRQHPPQALAGMGSIRGQIFYSRPAVFAQESLGQLGQGRGRRRRLGDADEAARDAALHRQQVASRQLASRLVAGPHAAGAVHVFITDVPASPAAYDVPHGWRSALPGTS